MGIFGSLFITIPAPGEDLRVFTQFLISKNESKFIINPVFKAKWQDGKSENYKYVKYLFLNT